MSGRETGPLEQYYDQKMLGMFTEDERSQLREFYCQLGNKFDEIVSFLKERLGCSETDAIEEAEQAIDRWNEDVETRDGPCLVAPYSNSDFAAGSLCDQRDHLKY